MSVASLILADPGMRIDKSLHNTHCLGGIGLIQLHLGRLLIKSNMPAYNPFPLPSGYWEILPQNL